MNLPSRLTVHDASYALDGGTTTLFATDEQGAEHRIRLPRNIESNLCQTTGQLYFDGELVPVRSLLESNVLRLLKDAVLAPRSTLRPGSLKLEPPFGVAGDDLKRLVAGSADENLRWLVDSVITYVEADAYGSGTSSAGSPPPNNRWG